MTARDGRYDGSSLEEMGVRPEECGADHPHILEIASENLLAHKERARSSSDRGRAHRHPSRRGTRRPAALRTGSLRRHWRRRYSRGSSKTK